MTTKTTQRTLSGKTELLTTSALFIALTAICSWISIPIPGTSVPINLATFAVLLAGVTLGRSYGALSMTVFLILGAVGLPVFHSFTSGVGIIAGPTGGFLIGYIFLALIAGFTKDKHVPFAITAVLGEAVMYAAGTAWFMYLTGSTLTVSLLSCVVPFIPGDIVKIVLVYPVSRKLSKVIQ